jgi:hypothetical protein
VTRSTVATVVVAALVATTAMVGVAAAGWSPRVEYVLGLALVVAIGAAVLRRLLGTVAEPVWPSPLPRAAEPPATDPRIGTIETAMRRGLDDAAIARRRVQPLLFDLATHRLRRHRGVSLVEDPDGAQALLGDEAFAVLTDVIEQPPAMHAMLRTVDAIERL